MSKTIIEQITSDNQFVTDQRYQQIIDPLKQLACKRSVKYGNSIAIMQDTSILDLCLMKLIRTRNMFNSNDQSDKYYDQIGDCINYLVYVLRRKLDNQKQLPQMVEQKFNKVQN